MAGPAHQTRDDPLKLILERMDRIEAELQAVRSPAPREQAGAIGEANRGPGASHSNVGTVVVKVTRLRTVPLQKK